MARVHDDSDAFLCGGLKRALAQYGMPAIFNTDQGSHFTSCMFPSVLKECGINISMDGKGRWRNTVFRKRLWRSVNDQCVDLNAFANDAQARQPIKSLAEA